MKNPFYYLLIIFLVVAGCSRARFVSEEELKRYPFDPENGLTKKIEKDNSVLQMSYRPIDLVLAQELKGITDSQERESIMKRYDSLDYFVLNLSRNGKEVENSFVGSPDKFKRVINYLSFNMGSDFYMVCNRDTIRSLDAAYVRKFGTTDATSVMVIFKSNLKNREADAKVFFDDSMLGTGLNEFDFENEKINNIPKIKLN